MILQALGGQTLGNYRILSQLGTGGMGAVWLAEHRVLGSRAAIKVLLPDLSAQPSIVQRFFDEARAATRIQDPGIVRVIDFGWHEGNAYLVMELLVGESLSSRLRRIDRLDPVQAMRLVQQCAITMAAAHAEGIIHRDLKPDNIFIIADGAVPGGERAKILDFGIAKLLDRDGQTSEHRTQTGAIFGTPAYMSPEQCRNAGGVDHRSDIYALGCVLFHAVCGRPPFIAPTQGDMLAAQLREVAPRAKQLVPSLPAALDDVIARCLAKDASQRYQSMAELVHAGSAITHDHTSAIPTRPSGPPQPVAIAQTTLGTGAGELSLPPRRRGRRLALAGVLAAVTAATAITVVVVTTGGSDAPSHAPAAVPPAPRAIDAAPPPADAVLPDAATVVLPPPGHPPRPNRPPPRRDAGVQPLAPDAALYDYR